MRTSNRKAETIISNAIFRVTIDRQNNNLKDAFINQDESLNAKLKSAISKASDDLFLGKNTTLSNR